MIKLQNSLPYDRYVAALKRQRERIAQGLKLDYLEDHISWGLCSHEREAWPDREDQVFPEDFDSYGRIAPLYPAPGQHCPFDDVTRNPSSVKLNGPFGCWYRCRLVGHRRNEPRVDGKRALELYDEAIAKAVPHDG